LLSARNGFPIEYAFTGNPRKAGPYPAGARWAEPSIESAAAAMRWLVEHPAEAARRGEQAREDLEAGFSDAAVARLIRARLDAIADRRRGADHLREMRAIYTEYRQLGSTHAALVDALVPEEAAVAVISKGDDSLLALGSRRASHFPQMRNGDYAGHHPADSHEAIAHLEDIRRCGVEWLVIPATASWWLPHYPAFAAHLQRRYVSVANQEGVGAIVRLAEPLPRDRQSEESWAVTS
jgi:hypothetical protein